MRQLSLLLVVLGLAGCVDHGSRCFATDKPNDVVGTIELRNPDTGQCEFFDLGNHCEPGCRCPDIGVALPNWAQCFGQCQPLLEADCLANTSCHASYQVNGAATPMFMGCFELPPTGPTTGACASVDAQTCSTHTDCFTVYSIGAGSPAYARCVAEILPVACSTLTTEAACKARTDCDAVFTGTNCTCDHSGCTCQTQTFKTCEPL